MAGLGAPATCLFLVDHDHVRMHPLGPDADELKPLDIDTTVAGRAFAWERTHTAKTDDGVRLWVPMIDGTARLGVVAVDLPSDTVDDDVVAAVEDLAGLAAVLVITKGHYTDAIEHVRPIGLGAARHRSTRWCSSAATHSCSTPTG